MGSNHWPQAYESCALTNWATPPFNYDWFIIVLIINSINGLKISLKEHSFIVEIIGGIILIPYLIIADLENVFKVIIIVIYFLLLAFELLNTSIEKLSDKISKEFNTDIKKVKDL